MALQSIAQLGKGGSGIPDALPKALRELQGLKFAVLAGAAANTKINLAAIRPEDTIVAAIQFAAGVPTDKTATMSIDDVRASGTLTVGTVIADNTVTVNGKVYTWKATENKLLRHIGLTGTANGNAAALAAMINLHDGNTLIATVSTNVVTVRALAEGTGGNSIGIAASANVTASAATLANGTTTGGVRSTDNTSSNNLVVVWFDKQ